MLYKIIMRFYSTNNKMIYQLTQLFSISSRFSKCLTLLCLIKNLKRLNERYFIQIVNIYRFKKKLALKIIKYAKLKFYYFKKIYVVDFLLSIYFLIYLFTRTFYFRAGLFGFGR